jgi:uncharacterized protein YprB with RNaseH-like and TPR domain
MSTLHDLRQVIRRIEASRPLRPAAEPIERLIGGEIVDTGDGSLLVVRHAFTPGHCHGHQPLDDAFGVSPDVLRLVARPGEEPPGSDGLLFIDVETTGLAGGTGTYAFLVGVGEMEAGRFVVTQYFMRDLDEEPALLSALTPRLAAATGVVTFNGSGFDLPLLETRFVLARRRWPGSLPHVDLLRPARRVWTWAFPDCRLATLEREALGVERDDDVPGAMIPVLYFQYLRTRQARPLGRVFRHNRDDVVALAALLGWFSRALDGDPSWLTPLERLGLGRLLEGLDEERSLGHYRAAIGGGLTGAAALWACLRAAAWEKRRERWDGACELWRAATGLGVFDPRPWEELAKFHEHRRREFAVARQLVFDALTLARQIGAHPHVVESFDYRLARLDRRLLRSMER